MTVPEFYVPNVGDKVKLATIGQYQLYAPDRTWWSWFVVKEVRNDKTARLVQYDEGVERGAPLVIPIAFKEGNIWRQVIQAPTGWEPKYTIHAKNADEIAKMKDWLESGRGIKVWQSQDLSCAGRQVFTPGDVEQVHWSMGSLEVIHDPDRIKFVDVLDERMRIATKNINHAGALDAACQISAEIAGQFKALVDDYLEEFGERLKKNNVVVIETGYGVLQRTIRTFDGFGYVRYRDPQRSSESILAFFVKPLSSREMARVGHLVFRIPGENREWYRSFYAKDGSQCGFGSYDAVGEIDEHESNPRARMAIHLGGWPDGLE